MFYKVKKEASRILGIQLNKHNDSFEIIYKDKHVLLIPFELRREVFDLLGEMNDIEPEFLAEVRRKVELCLYEKDIGSTPQNSYNNIDDDELFGTANAAWSKLDELTSNMPILHFVLHDITPDSKDFELPRNLRLDVLKGAAIIIVKQQNLYKEDFRGKWVPRKPKIEAEYYIGFSEDSGVKAEYMEEKLNPSIESHKIVLDAIEKQNLQFFEGIPGDLKLLTKKQILLSELQETVNEVIRSFGGKPLQIDSQYIPELIELEGLMCEMLIATTGVRNNFAQKLWKNLLIQEIKYPGVAKRLMPSVWEQYQKVFYADLLEVPAQNSQQPRDIAISQEIQNSDLPEVPAQNSQQPRDIAISQEIQNSDLPEVRMKINKSAIQQLSLPNNAPQGPKLSWNEESLLEAITIPHKETDLPGSTVYHGSIEGEADSVRSGPKNMGGGFGGKGLYIALDKNAAEENAANKGQAGGKKGIVMEGKLNLKNAYRIASIKIADRYGHPRADIEKGIFPAKWAKDPALQAFMHANFDIIIVKGVASAGYAGSDYFLVIHESAGSEAIRWTSPSGVQSHRDSSVDGATDGKVARLAVPTSPGLPKAKTKETAAHAAHVKTQTPPPKVPRAAITHKPRKTAKEFLKDISGDAKREKVLVPSSHVSSKTNKPPKAVTFSEDETPAIPRKVADKNIDPKTMQHPSEAQPAGPSKPVIEKMKRRFGVSYKPDAFIKAVSSSPSTQAVQFTKLLVDNVKKLSADSELHHVQYVILENGELIIARRYSDLMPLSYAEISDPKLTLDNNAEQTILINGVEHKAISLDRDTIIIFDAEGKKKWRRQYLKYYDISEGKPIVSAGQFYMSNGKILSYADNIGGFYGIENFNGRHTIPGFDQREIVEYVFANHGFPEANNLFHEHFEANSTSADAPKRIEHHLQHPSLKQPKAKGKLEADLLSSADKLNAALDQLEKIESEPAQAFVKMLRNGVATGTLLLEPVNEQYIVPENLKPAEIISLSGKISLLRVATKGWDIEHIMLFIAHEVGGHHLLKVFGGTFDPISKGIVEQIPSMGDQFSKAVSNDCKFLLSSNISLSTADAQAALRVLSKTREEYYFPSFIERFRLRFPEMKAAVLLEQLKVAEAAFIAQNQSMQVTLQRNLKAFVLQIEPSLTELQYSHFITKTAWQSEYLWRTEVAATWLAETFLRPNAYPQLSQMMPNLTPCMSRIMQTTFPEGFSHFLPLRQLQVSGDSIKPVYLLEHQPTAKHIPTVTTTAPVKPQILQLGNTSIFAKQFFKKYPSIATNLSLKVAAPLKGLPSVCMLAKGTRAVTHVTSPANFPGRAFYIKFNANTNRANILPRPMASASNIGQTIPYVAMGIEYSCHFAHHAIDGYKNNPNGSWMYDAQRLALRDLSANMIAYSPLALNPLLIYIPILASMPDLRETADASWILALNDLEKDSQSSEGFSLKGILEAQQAKSLISNAVHMTVAAELQPYAIKAMGLMKSVGDEYKSYWDATMAFIDDHPHMASLIKFGPLGSIIKPIIESEAGQRYLAEHPNLKTIENNGPGLGALQLAILNTVQNFQFVDKETEQQIFANLTKEESLKLPAELKPGSEAAVEWAIKAGQKAREMISAGQQAKGASIVDDLAATKPTTADPRFHFGAQGWREQEIDGVPVLTTTFNLDAQELDQLFNHGTSAAGENPTASLGNGEASSGGTIINNDVKEARERFMSTQGDDKDKPDFGDKTEITDIKLGVVAGGAVGLIFTLKCGASIWFGCGTVASTVGAGATSTVAQTLAIAGVTGTGTGTAAIGGVTVPIASGMADALLAGLAVAIPVAVVIIAVQIIYTKHLKVIAKHLEHGLENTGKDFKFINISVSHALQDAISRFNNGDLTRGLFLQEMQNVNNIILNKRSTIEDRADYAYINGKYDIAYNYLLNIASITQLSVDNHQMIQDQKLQEKILNDVSARSNLPMATLISQLSTLTGRKVLTLRQLYEAFALKGLIVKKLSESNEVRYFDELAKINTAGLGQAFAVPQVAKPEMPEQKSFDGMTKKTRLGRQDNVEGWMDKIAGAYYIFSNHVEKGSDKNVVEEARNNFFTIVKHFIPKLKGVELKGDGKIENCYDYFRPCIDKLWDNVIFSSEQYCSAFDYGVQTAIFDPEELRQLKVISSVNLLQDSITQLHAEGATEIEQQAAFEKLYRASVLLSQTQVEESDFSASTDSENNESTAQMLKQQAESIISNYSLVDGDYKTLQAIEFMEKGSVVLNSSEFSTEEKESTFSQMYQAALIIAASALNNKNENTKPSEESAAGDESLAKVISQQAESTIKSFELVGGSYAVLQAVESMHSNSIILNGDNISLDEKEAAFAKMNAAAEIILASEFQGDTEDHPDEKPIDSTGEGADSKPMTFADIEKSATNIVTIFSNVGGSYATLKEVEELQDYAKNKTPTSVENENAYSRAKEIKTRNVSADLITFCDGVIAKKYNNDSVIIYSPLARAGMQIFGDYTQRKCGETGKKLGFYAGSMHSIFPSVLTELTYLPVAAFKRDLPAWQLNLKGNFAAQCAKYTSNPFKSIGKFSRASQLVTTLASMTPWAEKHPCAMSNVSTVTNTVATAATGTRALKYVTDGKSLARLAKLSSAFIELGFNGVAGLYEFCSAELNLPEDREDFTLSDRFKEWLSQYVPSSPGNLPENPLYYMGKNWLKIAVALMIPTYVTYGYAIYQALWSEWSTCTGKDIEYALQAAVLNTAYYWKRNDYAEASERASAIKMNLNHLLSHSHTRHTDYCLDSDSPITKQAKCFLIRFETSKLLEEKKYEAVRSKTDFSHRNNKFTLNESQCPVLEMAQAMFQRFQAMVDDSKYFSLHIEQVYSEFNTLYDLFEGDEKLKEKQKQYESIMEVFVSIGHHIRFHHAKLMCEAAANDNLENSKAYLKSFNKHAILHCPDDENLSVANLYHLIGFTKHKLGESLDYLRYFEKIAENDKLYIHWFTLGQVLLSIQKKINNVKEMQAMLLHCFLQAGNMISAKTDDDLTENEKLIKSDIHLEILKLKVQLPDIDSYGCNIPEWIKTIEILLAKHSSKSQATKDKEKSGSSRSSNGSRATRKQLGWNCFDIAVNIEREDLVRFALGHAGDLDFRRLLAPEIRHVAALTVFHMNIQSDNRDTRDVEKTIKLVELFDISQALDPDDSWNRANIEKHILALLSQNKDSFSFPDGTLPESMRTRELQNLVSAYLDAHEAMRLDLIDCNNTLGNPAGKHLSLEELDAFFGSDDTNEKRRIYAEAFTAFQQSRNEHYTPHEQRFQAYCENETTYRQYVSDYYNKADNSGQKGWVAFQRSLTGEVSTSMIDVAAKMIGGKIILYQLKGARFEEIYQTKSYGDSIIHVEYQGNCHFVRLPGPPLLPAHSVEKKASAAATPELIEDGAIRDCLGSSSVVMQTPSSSSNAAVFQSVFFRNKAARRGSLRALADEGLREYCLEKKGM